MPCDSEKKGVAAGSQSGTYRGVVTGAHVHFVGGNDHLQVGGDRYNIRWLGDRPRNDPEKQAEIDRLREAWERLKEAGDSSPGVADCKQWLRSYVLDYHKINASKVT